MKADLLFAMAITGYISAVLLVIFLVAIEFRARRERRAIRHDPLAEKFATFHSHHDRHPPAA